MYTLLAKPQSNTYETEIPVTFHMPVCIYVWLIANIVVANCILLLKILT